MTRLRGWLGQQRDLVRDEDDEPFKEPLSGRPPGPGDLRVGVSGRLTEPAEVFDVGCGTGILLRDLARNFAGLRLTGIDLSEDMLEVARRPLADPRSPAPEFRGGLVYALPFPEGSFHDTSRFRPR